MQLRPAFKWGHDVLYKSTSKISQTLSTTHNMLAFVTVVDVIPIQIYAMNLAFLVWPEVTFMYCFCISLWISGKSWKWRPSSCDFILRNKKKSKWGNSVPFSSMWPVEGWPECASSSTEDSPMFQSRKLLSVFSQRHCLLSNSFTFDVVLHKPHAKLNANALFLQISH